MALPLPRVVPDVGPGGGLVTAMGGMNALNNAMIEKEINRIKKQYMPLTTQAEAASKLAYANLMGPQFLSKLLGNPSALANMPDAQRKTILDLVSRAGSQPTGANALNNVPQHTGVGQPSTNNFSGFLKNALKGFIDRKPQSGNVFSGQQELPDTSPAELAANAAPVPRPKDGVTLEGQQWYNAKGEPVYAEEEGAKNPMELTLRKGNGGQPEPTWEENVGKFLGVQKQGEKAGEIRAQSIGDIGEEMKQLSTTGANVDRLIDDFTNPDFVAMREEFPFLQDTQLKAAAHTGSPEQRNMIGTLIADLESFKGSTVNGFKGQTLKREFDYADKLKPTENDTVYTALGKLQTLKALKEIAWKKNIIIKNYMQKDKMSLADAVERADKQVDIKAVDKAVKEYTQPMYKLRNPKTGQTIMVPKKRAIQLGVKNV